MTKAIIYNELDGKLAIVGISPQCTLTVKEIAELSVPTGLPYKIIDAADVPTDRTHRNSWTVDDADLTDGVGA
jgi:hypothetical protein